MISEPGSIRTPGPVESPAMQLPQMTTRRWMIAVGAIAFAIGGSISCQRWLQQRQRIGSIGRERVAGALRAFEHVERVFVGGEIDVETFYVWSRRLMECQLELSRSKSDRIAAIRGHRGRLSILWDPRGDG